VVIEVAEPLLLMDCHGRDGMVSIVDLIQRVRDFVVSVFNRREDGGVNAGALRTASIAMSFASGVEGIAVAGSVVFSAIPNSAIPIWAIETHINELVATTHAVHAKSIFRRNQLNVNIILKFVDLPSNLDKQLDKV